MEIYGRYGTMISPTSKGLRFLQTHSIISLAVRYVSRIARNEDSFTVSYLINSCGLSPDSALSASKKVQFKTPTKPDSVIDFFKNHGFSRTQIIKLVEKTPYLLLSNPKKTLLPKFQFFYSKRISSCDLVRTLSSNPFILTSDLGTRIIPIFNFFKDFTRYDDVKVLGAFKYYPGILQRDFKSTFTRNLAVLREYGVPESHIRAKLVHTPGVYATRHDKFKRIAEEVKKLGFDPLKDHFLIALQALVQMSKSTLDRKFNIFKQWGWSDEEIVSAFEKSPRCMMLSQHSITAKMNFYVNTMGWKSSLIAYCPVLLGYSLERRIIPRCSVLQALLSKGSIEKTFIAYSLVCNEHEFLQKFVTRYEDPHLLKLYKEKLSLSK